MSSIGGLEFVVEVVVMASSVEINGIEERGDVNNILSFSIVPFVIGEDFVVYEEPKDDENEVETEGEEPSSALESLGTESVPLR